MKTLTASMIRRVVARRYPNARIVWIQNTQDGVIDTAIFHQLREDDVPEIAISLFDPSDPKTTGPFQVKFEVEEFFNEPPDPLDGFYGRDEMRTWPADTLVLCVRRNDHGHEVDLLMQRHAREFEADFTHFAIFPETLP